MKAIIPTGGRGTRMRPVTFSINKHFIPVANKPLIFYPIETVADAGIKEIAVTYNPGYLEEVQSLLGNGSQWGLKLTYVLQEKPIGLANIVQVCEEFLKGDSFCFHLGDNIFVDGIKNAVDYFQKEKPNGLITMMHHPENKRMGVPYFDDKGRLTKYIEKPENPPHDFAVPGVYFADSNFFKCFTGKDKIQPSARGEYEITMPFQWLIDHDFRVDVVEYKGKWLDPGKFDDWMEANKYLLDKKTISKNEGEVDEESDLSGKIEIGKGSKISHSKITGPVSIGDNVMISNSKIEPFASISNDCEIENATVGNSVLMPGVKIKNTTRSVEMSLIGTESEIIGTKSDDPIKLFIGEKSVLEI